jgi:hypothetical protein
MATDSTSFPQTLREHLDMRKAMDAAVKIDPAEVLDQQKNLLASLQARVQSLADAKAQVMADYDAEIVPLQEKIGALQKSIEDAAGAQAAAPPAAVSAPEQPTPESGLVDALSPDDLDAPSTPPKRSGKGSGTKKST